MIFAAKHKESRPSTAAASAQRHSSEPDVPRIVQSDGSCTNSWEAAYLRFQTPAQEISKFAKRLMKMGTARWPRNAEIVEMFCGRGNGLHALSNLGFTRLEGVDLSASLLAQYRGPGKLYVCDCRQLRFDDCSKDIVIIQGGLHHLESLLGDLEQTLLEANRVLREGGLLVLVEPWATPFLSFVHAVCRNSLARRISKKLDALATMIEYEGRTYQQWLHQPQVIRHLLQKYFRPEQYKIRWGKIMFVGQKRAEFVDY